MLLHDFSFRRQARRYPMRSIMNKRVNGLRMLILTLGIILSSSGCTISHVSPNIKNKSDFRPKDVASCQKKANALIDRELSLDRSYDRTGSDSLEISFARFDAYKKREQYFNTCISEQGN